MYTVTFVSASCGGVLAEGSKVKCFGYIMRIRKTYLAMGCTVDLQRDFEYSVVKGGVQIGLLVMHKAL